MASPVANPLTLVVTVKSDQDYQELKTLIEGIQQLPPAQNQITQALTRLGTVHFARFVLLNNQQLAVITTYDGSFEEYIDAFVNEIGLVFDKILAHVKDAPPLPVSANRAAFLKFVEDHDLKCVGPLYSAYPDLKVLDILTLQRESP